MAFSIELAGIQCINKASLRQHSMSELVHEMMGNAHSDAAAGAVSLFFNLEIVRVDFVVNFEFCITHGTV